MARRVTVTGTFFGTDVTDMDLYYTEVTASNLITSSISTTELANGLSFDIPDDATLVIARCSGSVCLGQTGSVTIPLYTQGTRWFTVNSDGSGTVQINAPVSDGPTTTFLSQSVNFNIYSSFTIEASATYPITFDGWYDSASGGSLLSTDNPLTITLSTYTSTDDFYARFS